MSLFKKFVQSIAQNSPSKKNDNATNNKMSLKLARIALHGTPRNISSLSYDPIQKLLALGTSNGCIYLFGRLGVEQVLYLNDETIQVKKLEFIVNKGLLCGVCERRISASKATDEAAVESQRTKSYLYVWSLKSMNLKLQLTLNSPRDAITVIYSPIDTEFLLIGTKKGHVIPLNFVRRWVSSNQVTLLNDKQVNCMQLHPTLPTLLLSGHSGGYCCTYDFAQKTKEVFMQKNFFEHVTAVSWHPSKSFFVASYANGLIMLWNRKQQSVLQQIPFFQSMGVVTDLYWIKKDIFVNVNDIEDMKISAQSSLAVDFDDDDDEDEEIDEDNTGEAVLPNSFHADSPGDVCEGEDVPPQHYVPSPTAEGGPELETRAPNSPEAVTQDSSKAASTPQQQTPKSPKSPQTSSQSNPPLSPKNSHLSVTSQDQEELSSTISGLFKLTPTPDLTKCSSTRINKRNGTLFTPLAPDEPWSFSKLPQFAGLVTFADKHFHILDLQETSFCRVGTCLGEPISQMFLLNEANFSSSLFRENEHGVQSPESPSRAGRQNWPLCGGFPATFPNTDEKQHRNSDILITLSASRVLTAWGINSELGRVQRIYGLHKQKHEVLHVVPWSSMCLLSAVDNNSLSFLYLKTLEEVILNILPEDYQRTEHEGVKITSLCPVNSMDVVLVGFSNGVVLGVSASSEQQCVFKAQLEDPKAQISSLNYAHLNGTNVVFVGDSSGGVHVYPLLRIIQRSEKPSPVSLAEPLTTLPAEEDRSALVHTFVLSKSGKMANRADERDLPAMVSSHIVRTNLKGSQIITLNTHLNRKQTELPPIYLHDPNPNLKVVCPVIVQFLMKGSGISISSGPVTFSIKGTQDTKHLLWIQMSSLDVLVGHTSAATGKLINLKMPLEKGECLDGKDKITLMHDVAQCTYRLYSGITLLGVCKYSRKDAPLNEPMTAVRLIPQDEHKEYSSTQAFLQSIVQKIQIFYNNSISLKDLRFSKKNPDIQCVFSTESFYPGEYFVACRPHSLQVYRIRDKGASLQLINSVSLLGSAALRDVRFSTYYSHTSLTVLKENGHLEIFSTKNGSLERMYHDSFMGGDMIRTRESKPTHITISDDGRIVAAAKDFFLQCVLLKPNDLREIAQPMLHISGQSIPRKPASLSQNLKGFLSGASNDSQKLNQALSNVDIEQRFVKLLDVHEEDKKHLPKEVMAEKNRSSSTRYIQGHMPQSKEDADLDRYKQELLQKHHMDEKEVAVRGDTSQLAGQMDDTRALVYQAREKAKERGEKLQKLEDSTRELKNSAQTFFEKTQKLKEKSKPGIGFFR